LFGIGPLGFAVESQRAPLADGVGTLEDPVLPGGEPAEDLAVAVFGAGEAQVGLHSGQSVGRQAATLLDRDPHLVLVVDVVGDDGDQPRLVRILGLESPRFPNHFTDPIGLAEKADFQPGRPVGHGVGPGIHGGRCHRVGLIGIVEHVGAVGGQGQLEERSAETGAGLDQREQRAGRQIETPERARDLQTGFVDEPVLGQTLERAVHLDDGVHLALGLEQQQTDRVLVGAQM